MKRLKQFVAGVMIAMGLGCPISVLAKDYQQELDNMINYYSHNQREYDSAYDMNKDGIIDILDVAYASKQMGTIDITKIKKNYLSIISSTDKKDYEELGIPILTNKSFVVTKDGIDLFAYVNAAREMELEIIEGDRDFRVIYDKLYLTGSAPAIAKVRLVNDYAQSEPFYIYGTSDRTIHDFTYDYLMNIIENQ